MTVESVLAHGLKTSVFGSQWNAEYGDNLALLDPDRIKSGLLANRPAAGVAHRFFFATDNQRLYYDTGAAWVEQSTAAAAHAATHAGGGADAVTLAQSQITNLAADLAAKAAATHAHAIADVTGLQSSLDGKAALTGNQTIGGVKSFTSPLVFSAGVTGVADGSNAAAGAVGEVIRAQVLQSGAISLGSSTNVYNICGITLTAGDWQISGAKHYLPTGNITDTLGGVSKTSATLPSVSTARGTPNAGEYLSMRNTPSGAYNNIPHIIPAYQYNFSGANVSLYLVARADFSSGAVTACGYIEARRMR